MAVRNLGLTPSPRINCLPFIIFVFNCPFVLTILFTLPIIRGAFFQQTIPFIFPVLFNCFPVSSLTCQISPRYRAYIFSSLSALLSMATRLGCRRNYFSVNVNDRAISNKTLLEADNKYYCLLINVFLVFLLEFSIFSS